MYIAAKMCLNSLSGKFGQRVVSKKSMIFEEMPNPDAFKNLASFEYDAVESLDGNDIIGFLVHGEKKTSDLVARLPTYISVFILAHARR